MAGAVDDFAVQMAGSGSAAHGAGAAGRRPLSNQVAEGQGGAEQEYQLFHAAKLVCGFGVAEVIAGNREKFAVNREKRGIGALRA